MAELKPCPFCGGEADYQTENFGAKVWVKCYVCGVQTSRYDTNLIVEGKGGKDWAATAWNRRVPQTVVNQHGENCTHISNCGTLNLKL